MQKSHCLRHVDKVATIFFGAKCFFALLLRRSSTLRKKDLLRTSTTTARSESHLIKNNSNMLDELQAPQASTNRPVEKTMREHLHDVQEEISTNLEQIKSEAKSVTQETRYQLNSFILRLFLTSGLLFMLNAVIMYTGTQFRYYLGTIFNVSKFYGYVDGSHPHLQRQGK